MVVEDVLLILLLVVIVVHTETEPQTVKIYFGPAIGIVVGCFALYKSFGKGTRIPNAGDYIIVNDNQAYLKKDIKDILIIN